MSSPLDDSCLMVSVQFSVTLGRGCLGYRCFHLPSASSPEAIRMGLGRCFLILHIAGSFLMHLIGVIWVGKFMAEILGIMLL